MNEVPSRHIAAAPLVRDSSELPPPAQRSYGWLALLLGLFQFLIGIAAAVLIVLAILLWPGEDLPGALPAGAAPRVLADSMTRLLLSTTAGATLGAVLHSLVGLHLHAAVLRDFAPRYTGSYLIGPFAAALLGLALFALLQGGLLGRVCKLEIS